MNKGVEILFQNVIHDLCLVVRLWMIRRSHPELGSTKAEEFLPKIANNESRSETKLCGNPWCLQTMSRNNRAVLYAELCGGSAPKWAHFEKQSMKTKIMVNSCDDNSPVMKSNDISSQTAEGIGNNCRRPTGFLVSYFVC